MLWNLYKVMRSKACWCATMVFKIEFDAHKRRGRLMRLRAGTCWRHHPPLLWIRFPIRELHWRLNWRRRADTWTEERRSGSGDRRGKKSEIRATCPHN
ncbi:hypothetical protein IEQ34_014947 [Dendrobium chrysotoxum]|uniref:Secreted protein n=1 Tax=Dendrobium chrysotoxum TaxID=161865 RepID=A0AAV7GN48_DENCH|nr:hypothetical protein IEQ34_014947 [Dendrobium chrysotoxum]